ncbi:MAG: hypothetical protein H7281_02025 [Bacteriovorax sp.]|nr:hypothetical protein [Bacteriovorax sp.]
MKKIFLVFLIALFVFSCGKKGESSKAKFKIFAGNMTDADVQSVFPGGLLVLGRSSDGQQSFTLAYQSGLELNLKKGDWEFATIGWMGANPMEGNQQCSFQHFDIQVDSAVISFNMSKQGCLTLAGSGGNRFTDPLFYDYLGGTYNGFKKLQIKTCPDLITNCSGAQAAPDSFNLDIPAMTKGVSLNLLPKGLISNCISGGTSISNITPPHGGSNGFVGVRVTTFAPPLTSFNNPSGVVQDSTGNIFVLNTAQHNIRKIDTSAVITTFAGPSSAAIVFGAIDATGTAARFKNPAGIAIDSSNNIYVADTYNHTIRKITTAGIVSTLAGTALTQGTTDATGSSARFNTPNGIAVGSSTGNVYVADTANQTIRKITPGGIVTTIAGGAGLTGTTDATGTAARFNSPRGIAIDASETYLYVSDTQNSTIRKINISGGVVTTLAGIAGTSGHLDATGTLASFDMPIGLTVDSSANVYVADKNNQNIRMINSSGVVTTFAGVYATNGSVEGPVATAKFNYPVGITRNASNDIFVADATNHTIRKITSGIVSTLAGNAGVHGNTDTGGGAGCTGVPKSYFFQHGDGEAMSSPQTANSVDINSADASIALAPFYGVITDPVYANLPVISGAAHALYFYNGTSMGSPLYANQGDFIYYNGSSWSKFSESNSVKLLLQQ